jgi:hypothetical protein
MTNYDGFDEWEDDGEQEVQATIVEVSLKPIHSPL